MANNISVGILGLGSSLPSKILTNSDLEKIVDTTDEWIVKRTGISSRYILEEDEPAYNLAVDAAKKALLDANIDATEIDLIIVATETPDYMSPSTSCIVSEKIGATKAAAFDINAACTGFVYSLNIAQQFILTGVHKYILVIGCEALSKAVDWKDRATCVLFGDGAGAAVVGRVEDGFGILSSVIGAEGNLGFNITIPGFYNDLSEKEKRPNDFKRGLWMDGSEVFKFAVKILSQATEMTLKKAGISLSEVSYIFPHQANIRIIDGASKRLDIDPERIVRNVHRLGNISSASIPVALDEYSKQGLLNKGDNIVLVAFGGGLTWGACTIKWGR